MVKLTTLGPGTAEMDDEIADIIARALRETSPETAGAKAK
jgi:hypothetical protein